MRICDLTHAYTETSGGIRTYIDAKRRFIREQTDWDHILIYPGAEDSIEREGRLTTVRIASPLIPGAAPYRLFVRREKVRRTLLELAPDVIELTSMYTAPLIAFSARSALARRQHRCAVSTFYFTDFPTAYVEPAITNLAGPWMGSVAKRIATWYARQVIGRCDFGFTSMADHEKQLRALGVEIPLQTITLGVDLETFAPHRRSADVRARFGVNDGGILLVYAGRLDSEKHIDVLTGALEGLPESAGARLILVGEGPHRDSLLKEAERIREHFGEERLFILPYMKEKEDLAELLASGDVYVTAGPHETFGFSIVEAQAAGLPVVGVAAGALLDRVVLGTGMLGPVRDSEAMAANILEVAAQRHEMGRAARLLVEQTLSWDACFTTIFGEYERGLELSPSLGTPIPMAA
jgi:alpha-1,6-mannosyltransferase